MSAPNLVKESDVHSMKPTGFEGGGTVAPEGAAPLVPASPLGGDDVIDPNEVMGFQVAPGDTVPAPGITEETPEQKVAREAAAAAPAQTPEEKAAADAAAAPAAPAPVKLKVGTEELDEQAATARLTEHASLAPFIKSAKDAGYALQQVFDEGLEFIGASEAFEKDPAVARQIVEQMVASAREIHGDKFVLDENFTATVDPNNLDDAGKFLHAENKRLTQRAGMMQGHINVLAAKVNDMSKMLEAGATVGKDLATLHSALPETVGTVDSTKLAAMKAETGLSDPVLAYKAAAYKAPDGAAAAVTSNGTSTGGAATQSQAGQPALAVPDAPRPSSVVAIELDPDDPKVGPDQIIAHVRRGGRVKGYDPGKYPMNG